MERDDASPLMGATVDCLEVNQVLVRWRWWGARGRGRNQALHNACALGLEISQWFHSRTPSTICIDGKMNVRRGQNRGKNWIVRDGAGGDQGAAQPPADA